MNRIQKDGRALLTLSGKVERERNKRAANQKDAESKPAPPNSIQRQDTDYDVKPEIPTPDPSRRRTRQERAGHQAQATLPDSGALTKATQMGESEHDDSHDFAQTQARMLRALHL